MSSNAPRKNKPRAIRGAIAVPSTVEASDSVSISAPPKSRPRPRPVTGAAAVAADAQVAEAEKAPIKKKVPAKKTARAAEGTEPASVKPPPAAKKTKKRGATAASSVPAPSAFNDADSAHGSEDLEPAPVPIRALRVRKPPAPPLPSNPDKKLSKKAQAEQARLAKAQKQEAERVNVVKVAAYERRMQDWGFEATPAPPSPPSAAFIATTPEVTDAFRHQGAQDAGEMPDDPMDVDECGLRELFDEINAGLSPEASEDDDDGTFPGFRQALGPSIKRGMTPEEDEVKEEDEEEGDGEEKGPLHTMEGLTSEADVFEPSSPSKRSDDFVMSSGEEEMSESDDEDVEETPVARKVVTMKGKGKAKEVVKPKPVAKTNAKSKAKANIVKSEPILPKKTKGTGLREQILTARDQPSLDKEISQRLPDGGNAPSGTAASRGRAVNSDRAS